MEAAKPAAKGHGWGQVAVRIVTLLAGGISLYLLAPKLISVLASWPQLKTLKPGWFALAIFFESMSYVSLWAMQRVALHATSCAVPTANQLVACKATRCIAQSDT